MNFYTRFHVHNGMRKGGAEWIALSSTLDLPIVVRVRGEQSLYVNIKDKGLVCVTGCCHQIVLTHVDFVQKKLVGGDSLCGHYGGLHIAPVGPFNAEGEETVKGMAKYN